MTRTFLYFELIRAVQKATVAVAGSPFAWASQEQNLCGDQPCLTTLQYLSRAQGTIYEKNGEDAMV